jgi:Type VI secretion system/phage-baseplate injector OB domain
MSGLAPCGLELGIVQDVNDPHEMGRIKIYLPSRPERPADWMMPILPLVEGYSKLSVVVGDEVLVAFVHGDIGQPYVLGAVGVPGRPSGRP